MYSRKLHNGLLDDERGASIVIALVFFMICAIVGSIVLTSASVNAKSVATHKDVQQAEYAVTSAAQLVGEQFASAVVKVEPSQNAATGAVSQAEGSVFAKDFWTKFGSKILDSRSTSSSWGPKPLTLSAIDSSVDDVDVTVTVDSDLDITIDLSKSGSDGKPLYSLTTAVQCIPTYNASGQLTSFSYEPAVIKKPVMQDE